MPNNAQQILVFSSVVWNFYRTRPHEIALGLQNAGHQVTFVEPIVYRNAQTTRLSSLVQHPERGVTIVRRASRLGKGIALLCVETVRNMWLVLRQRPTAVITGDVWMSTGIVMACKVLGIRCVFDNMDFWPAVEKTPAQRWVVARILYPLLARFSYAVMNTSPFLQEYMQKRATRAVYVPNAKSADELRAYETLHDAAAAPTHRVAFVATLRDWYDYAFLCTVFSRLPDVHLDIYGDGPERAAVEECVSHHANIRLHGPVDSARIPTVMMQSDFGVLPLRDTAVTRGVFPIKLLDYWAARKPVIGTDVPALRSLADGAALTTVATVDAWVDTIRAWYENAETLRTAGEHGHAQVQDTYSYAILIPKIISLLEK